MVTVFQSSIEEDLYDVKFRLFFILSKPDEPGLPFVFIEERFI